MEKRFYPIILSVMLLGIVPVSAQPADTLSLSQRMFILSKTYSAIQMYFAHWQSVPHLNLDSLYADFLDQAVKTPDRYQFDLLMMEFIAHLNNGHSWYFDPWLRNHFGQPLGFYLTDLNGHWVVTRSQVNGLKPGTIIRKINGKSTEAWYQQNRRYINASSERSRRTKFTFYSFLFPQTLTVETADGKTVTIHRNELNRSKRPKVEGRWLSSGKIAYIRIPSFAGPQFEATALEWVKKFRNANALIIDLRGNGGGNTPVKLIDALQDRPYRFWSESTPVTFGLFKAYAQIYQMFKHQLPETRKAYLENVSGIFSHSQLLWPSTWEEPDSTLYTGKLIFLVDRRCASACEDFVVPFKDNHRAVIIGERTMGSSGQPFIQPFEGGISVAIGTKREYMPDGTPFEGVGIAPDIEVMPTVKDLRNGRDVVLKRALSVAKQ